MTSLTYPVYRPENNAENIKRTIEEQITQHKVNITQRESNNQTIYCIYTYLLFSYIEMSRVFASYIKFMIFFW